MLETWTFGVDGQANGSCFLTWRHFFFNGRNSVTQPVLGTMTNQDFHRHGCQRMQGSPLGNVSTVLWNQARIKRNKVLFYLHFKAPIQTKPRTNQETKKPEEDEMFCWLYSRQQHLKMEKREGESSFTKPVSLLFQLNPDCDVVVVLLRSVFKPSVGSRHWENLFLALVITFLFVVVSFHVDLVLCLLSDPKAWIFGDNI